MEKNSDPWQQFLSAAHKFNETRKRNAALSYEKALDKTMLPQRLRTLKNSDLLSINYVIRKPELLRTKFKAAMCLVTSAMMHMETQ